MGAGDWRPGACGLVTSDVSGARAPPGPRRWWRAGPGRHSVPGRSSLSLHISGRVTRTESGTWIRNTGI